MTGEPVEFAGDGGCLLRGTRFVADASRARVLVVHGLGEHSGRYHELADGLVLRGFSVLAYDQRGHGRSEGTRGHAESVDQLVRDLECATAAADTLLGRDGPPVLFGHSMGGLVALRYLDGGASQERPDNDADPGRPHLAGAVVSAPWLTTLNGPGPVLRGVARMIDRVAPRAALKTRLKPDVLTRDPERAAAFLDDPLIHQRMSPHLFFSVERAQARVLSREEGWGLPVLMMVPDADGLVDPAPTRRLAEGLRSQGVELAVLHGVRHEPLQDFGRESVIERVGEWVEGVVAPGPNGPVRTPPDSRGYRRAGPETHLGSNAVSE